MFNSVLTLIYYTAKRCDSDNTAPLIGRSLDHKMYIGIWATISARGPKKSEKDNADENEVEFDNNFGIHNECIWWGLSATSTCSFSAYRIE